MGFSFTDQCLGDGPGSHPLPGGWRLLLPHLVYQLQVFPSGTELLGYQERSLCGQVGHGHLKILSPGSPLQGCMVGHKHEVDEYGQENKPMIEALTPHPPALHFHGVSLGW